MDQKRKAEVAAVLERLAVEVERVHSPKYLAGKARVIFEALQGLPEADRDLLVVMHDGAGSVEEKLARYNERRSDGETIGIRTLYKRLPLIEQAFLDALPFSSEASNG